MKGREKGDKKENRQWLRYTGKSAQSFQGLLLPERRSNASEILYVVSRGDLREASGSKLKLSGRQVQSSGLIQHPCSAQRTSALLIQHSQTKKVS